MSESSSKATEQICNCGGSASLSKAASEPCLEDNTAAGSLCNHWHSASKANILLGGTGPGSPTGSPIQLKSTSSGYSSFGFEPSPSRDSLSSRIRNELISILDPPHPTGQDNTAEGSLCNHWHSASKANILLGGTGPGSPTGSPIQLKSTSSGYSSFGFEPSPSRDSLSSRIRNELISILDPPHPTGDWKSLAEGVGFEMKYIRWLANCNSFASPTDILLTTLECKKYPLYKLAEKLRNIGREDAASLVDAQRMLRETEV